MIDAKQQAYPSTRQRMSGKKPFCMSLAMRHNNIDCGTYEQLSPITSAEMADVAVQKYRCSATSALLRYQSESFRWKYQNF